MRDPGADHRPERLSLHRSFRKASFRSRTRAASRRHSARDQSISFQPMEQKFRAVRGGRSGKDPAVQSVVGFSAAAVAAAAADQQRQCVHFTEAAVASARTRPISVIARLRAEARHRCRARGCSFRPVQDLRVGGRQGNAQYQYTIQADSLQDLEHWVPKITDGAAGRAGTRRRQFRPAGSRPRYRAADRPATGRALGLTATQIDNTLYDAFGQRQVSTIYKDLNQYHVVMEVAPEFWQNPETLQRHLCQHVWPASAARSRRAPWRAPLRWRLPQPMLRPRTQIPPPPQPDVVRHRGRGGAQSGAERDCQYRSRRSLHGIFAQHPGREHGAAVRLCDITRPG